MNSFGIPNIGVKVVPFIFGIGEKGFLKILLLKSWNLFWKLMLIWKGNSIRTGMLGTIRSILAKIYLIFYKKKLVCYTSVFHLVNADLVCRNFFCRDVPCFASVIARHALYWTFSNLFWKFPFSVLSYKNHYSQDEV